MADTDPLVERVVNYAITGIYQHGEYAKAKPELSTRQADIRDDGLAATFIVDVEDEHGDRVMVTVTRLS